MDKIAVGIAQANAKKQGFLYNGEIGLKRWRVARDKVVLGKIIGTPSIVNLPFLGDSLTEGIASTLPLTDGYVARIRAKFTAMFEDLGSGLIPVTFPDTDNFPAYSPLWAFSGSSWSLQYGGYGFNAYYMQSDNVGETATLSFNGTGLAIILIQAATFGAFKVNIDGGADINLTSYHSPIVFNGKLEITGLSDGPHTAVITNQSKLYLMGAYPLKGSNGVRVHMVGKSGGLAVAAQVDMCIPAMVDLWNAPLSVISYLANDYSHQTPLASYESQLQKLITRALSFGDVLLTSMGISNASPTTIPQIEYVNVIKKLALQNNCAYLDLFSAWGGDFNYAYNTLGVIKTGDTVHFNDLGHYNYAEYILDALMS